MPRPCLQCDYPYVPSDAEKCPNCGRFPREQMSNSGCFLLIFLAGIAVFIVKSINSNSTNVDYSSSSQSTSNNTTSVQSSQPSINSNGNQTNENPNELNQTTDANSDNYGGSLITCF